MHKPGTRFTLFGTEYTVRGKRRDGCYDCSITKRGPDQPYSVGTSMLFEHQQISDCLKAARKALPR